MLYQRFGKRWTAYVIVLMLVIVLGAAVRSTPGHDNLPLPYVRGTIAYDVSWPNCQRLVPVGQPAGIVGVTGGLSLKPNPCLAQQATWFRPLWLYINTGYPGLEKASRFAPAPLRCTATNEACIAYNYGYQAADYAVQLATKQGIHATWWWLDVETENSWSDDPVINRLVLRGAVAAIRQATLFARVGYYAYPAQWQLITGKWHGDHLPVWEATGTTSLEVAKRACHGPSFTGGPRLMAQYVEILDRDYVC